MARLLPVRALSFLGGGSLLAASSGSRVEVYTINGKVQVCSFKALQAHQVHGIVCIEGLDDGEGNSREYCCIYGGEEYAVHEITINGGAIGTTRLRGAELGEWIHCVAPLTVRGGLGVVCCGLSSNTVVACHEDGGFQRSPSPTQALLYSMALQGDSWDDLVAASGTIFSSVLVWKVSTGVLLHSLQGHKGSILRVTFSGVSQELLSASDDRTMKMWDLVKGTCTATFSGHTARVWQCCFLDQAGTLLSASEDNKCTLWSRGGRSLARLEGHVGRGVWAVAIHEGRKVIATGGTDCTVKIWDARKWMGGTINESPPIDFRQLAIRDHEGSDLFTAVAVESVLGMVAAGCTSGRVMIAFVRLGGVNDVHWLFDEPRTSPSSNRVDTLLLLRVNGDIHLLATWESGERAAVRVNNTGDFGFDAISFPPGERVVMAQACTFSASTLACPGHPSCNDIVCTATHTGSLTLHTLTSDRQRWVPFTMVNGEDDRQRAVCVCHANLEADGQLIFVGTLAGGVALYNGVEPSAAADVSVVDEATCTVVDEGSLFEPVAKRTRRLTRAPDRGRPVARILNAHKGKAVSTIQFCGSLQLSGPGEWCVRLVSCGLDGAVCVHTAAASGNVFTLAVITNDCALSRLLGGVLGVNRYGAEEKELENGLCVGLKGHTLSVWDTRTNAKITEHETSTNKRFIAHNFSTSEGIGKVMIAWMFNHNLHVLQYPAAPSELVEHLTCGTSYHAREVYDVHWIHGEGKDLFLSCSEDCEISLVQSDGSAVLAVPRVHPSSVRCAAVCEAIGVGRQRGWLVACGGGKSHLSVWFLTSTLVRIQAIHSCIVPGESRNVHFRILSMAAVGDEETSALLFLGGSDAVVRCVVVNTAFEGQKAVMGRGSRRACPGPVLAMAHILIGQSVHLFMGFTSGEVGHFKTQKGCRDDILSDEMEFDTIRLHQSGVNSLDIVRTETGHYICSGGDDQAVRVTQWCPAKGFGASHSLIPSCAAFRKVKALPPQGSEFAIRAVSGDQRLYSFLYKELPEEDTCNLSLAGSVLVDPQAVAALAVNGVHTVVAGQGLEVI